MLILGQKMVFLRMYFRMKIGEEAGWSFIFFLTIGYTSRLETTRFEKWRPGDLFGLVYAKALK